jgi:hypothetical protein
MDCQFCATGQAGFRRHLREGEIVEQVAAAMREARPRRLSNVVFMGMGEPLANYDRVWRAVVRLNGDMGLSARHLTLSTVGLVPGIRRLAAETLPVNLAVSLHAANDVLRDELVPINRRYPLGELADACADYVATSGRRLSIEWALIDGVNDRGRDAAELAAFARPLAAHVNLIPLNPTPGYQVVGSAPDRVRDFRGRLAALGVNATIRATRGADIDAACGQLAASLTGPDAVGDPVRLLRAAPNRQNGGMARTRRSGVVRPSWLWFLLLDGGIVVLTKLAVSKTAYDKAAEVTGDALPPREVLQALLIGTAVVHVTEALVAGRMARRRGLPARGWRLRTLVVGFPSLLALRRNASAG